MKITKLSLALAGLLMFGFDRAALAQDHDPGIVPPSAGGSQAPASAFGPGSHGPVVLPDRLTLTTSSLLPISPLGSGSSETFSIDMKTGDYTVQSSPGGGSHMIELKSMGTLSKSQLTSLQKSLNDVSSDKLPAQLPGALVEGAGQFTISWQQGVNSGSVSGVNNPKAAVEGQDAAVKKLWGDVTPTLSKLSKLETSLVKNHPYSPDIRTVEEPAANAEAATADAKKAPDAKFPESGIEFTTKNPWMPNDDVTFRVNPDGSFTMQRPLHEVLRGQLSAKDFATIERDYGRAVKSDLPVGMPGIIPDMTGFTLTTGDGKTITSGSLNGNINEPGNPQWRALLPLLNKLQGEEQKISPEPPVAQPLKAGDADKDNGIAGQKVGENLAAETIAAAAKAAAKAGTTVEGGSGVRGTIDRPNTGITDVLDRDVSGDEGAKADKR